MIVGVFVVDPVMIDPLGVTTLLSGTPSLCQRTVTEGAPTKPAVIVIVEPVHVSRNAPNSIASAEASTAVSNQTPITHLSRTSTPPSAGRTNS